jgi:hypothetical protein
MWSDIRTIYVTRAVRPLKLYGFSEVESDREGYRKYRCTLSEVDFLRYKSQRLGRR